jgi:hypothetical protein
MIVKGTRRLRCDTKKPLEYTLGFISRGGSSASVFDGLYAPYDIFNGKIRFRKTTLSAGNIVYCYWNGSIWFFSNNSGTVAAGVFGASAVDFPWQVGGYTTSLIVTRKDRLFY